MTTDSPLVALARLTFDAADDVDLGRRVRELTAPGAVFRLSGTDTDVDGYLRHLAGLRSSWTRAELTVLDQLAAPHGDGTLAAFRCHVRMTMPDGSTAQGESHVFGATDATARVTALYDVGRFLEPTDTPPAPTRQP